MKGQIIINDQDAWETWGVTLCKGGYEKLMKPPAMKDYIVNESRLEHGKRIIVNSPKVSSRDVSLQFFIEGSSRADYLSKLDAFVLELQKGKIELFVSKLDTLYKLVYIESSSYGDFGIKKGKLAVRFVEPNPNDRKVEE